MSAPHAAHWGSEPVRQCSLNRGAFLDTTGRRARAATKRTLRGRGRAGSRPGSTGSGPGSRRSSWTRRSPSSSVPTISAKSARASTPTAAVRTVWCGAPARIHDSADVSKLGRGSHTARATGSFGSGSFGATTSISLAVSRNRSPRSARPTTTAGPGVGVEHQPDRVLPAADAQRMDLQRRRRAAMLGHTSSMCAPRTRLAPGPQVVRVVLHEGSAACRGPRPSPSRCGAGPRSSSRPRRRTRSRRPSGAERPARAAGEARRDPRSSW